MSYTYTILTGAKTTAGSIKNWLNKGDIPSTIILTEAEQFIYSRLRTREMRTSATLSLVDGVDYVALPTGFIKLVDGALRSTTDGSKIDLISESALEDLRYYNTTTGLLTEGVPTKTAIFDERFQFDFKSDGARTLRCLYYKSPTVLSGANETNFVTIRYPTIIRTACLAFGADWRKDNNEFQKYYAMAEAQISRANAEADESREGQLWNVNYR